MKDAIVEEIHRFREEYARNFNYDTHAMCEDLRSRQRDSGQKVVGADTKRPVSVKPSKAVFGKTLAVRK